MKISSFVFAFFVGSSLVVAQEDNGKDIQIRQLQEARELREENLRLKSELNRQRALLKLRTTTSVEGIAGRGLKGQGPANNGGVRNVNEMQNQPPTNVNRDLKQGNPTNCNEGPGSHDCGDGGGHNRKLKQKRNKKAKNKRGLQQDNPTNCKEDPGNCGGGSGGNGNRQLNQKQNSNMKEKKQDNLPASINRGLEQGNPTNCNEGPGSHDCGNGGGGHRQLDEKQNSNREENQNNIPENVNRDLIQGNPTNCNEGPGSHDCGNGGGGNRQLKQKQNNAPESVDRGLKQGNPTNCNDGPGSHDCGNGGGGHRQLNKQQNSNMKANQNHLPKNANRRLKEGNPTNCDEGPGSHDCGNGGGGNRKLNQKGDLEQGSTVTVSNGEGRDGDSNVRGKIPAPDHTASVDGKKIFVSQRHNIFHIF